jgi:hypothetical protein
MSFIYLHEIERTKKLVAIALSGARRELGGKTAGAM